MKGLYFVILLLIHIGAYGQVSFRKSYIIKQTITQKGQESVHLQKEELIKFADLSTTEKDSLRRIYKPGDTLVYTVERIAPAGKVLVTERVPINQKFLEALKLKKGLPVVSLPAREGYVKFEENKVWVNPIIQGGSGSGTYYYQLKNRQTISLGYKETSISAMTIPIKYRFGNTAENISEEFTTDVNVNLFVGRTINGTTTFQYREKVGNSISSKNWTVGGMLGASTVTLDKGNTTASINPILDDEEITKGVATLGLGGIYTFGRINGGIFYGWDFSIGDDAERWNYNRKPWLGIALGYSLLPF